jgi:thiol-disulfide isomerase/thioredoxin
MMHTALIRAALCAAVLLSALPAAAQTSSPAGLWDATVVPGNNIPVPFKFEITQKGGALSGSFFDGEVRIPSTAATLEGNHLVLSFAQYGSKVDVTFTGNKLEGRYDRGTRGRAYAFSAVRAASTPPTGRAPQIAGEYRIPLQAQSNKGESSWRLVLRQNGPQVNGAIMRVDGDSGTLSGTFKDGKVVLSHFSGARPTVVEVTPQADGSLTLTELPGNSRTAYKVTDARAKTVAPLTDPKLYTRVKDPNEKFRFAFPELDSGKVITDADPRFQGKVVIVSVTGSWCPNCHDEAPFLSKLYRDYKPKGLEIVALSFEEADQLKNPDRVRGFRKQYGLTYPFLIAGLPEEAPEKIPQAVNLNTFPATFVLGRDGKVKAVHAGYASKATGDFYLQEQKAFIAEIEKLLAERPAAGTR